MQAGFLEMLLNGLPFRFGILIFQASHLLAKDKPAIRTPKPLPVFRLTYWTNNYTPHSSPPLLFLVGLVSFL